MVSNSRNKIHQTWGWKLCELYTGDARQTRAKLVRPIKGSFPFRAAEERWRRRNGNGIERACKRGDMNEQSIFRAYSTEIDLFLPRGAIPVRFMTDSTSNESGWRMGGGSGICNICKLLAGCFYRGLLGPKLLLAMGCVKLSEKICIHLPSVGEQTAN